MEEKKEKVKTVIEESMYRYPNNSVVNSYIQYQFMSENSSIYFDLQLLTLFSFTLHNEQ